MNQNTVIFKYTILAYNELKKIKYNKTSSPKEDEFFNKFTKSIQKNNAFISSDILSEELANIFLILLVILNMVVNMAKIFIRFLEISLWVGQIVLEDSKKSL